VVYLFYELSLVSDGAEMDVALLGIYFGAEQHCRWVFIIMLFCTLAYSFCHRGHQLPCRSFAKAC
jgi:hypothetical protein